MEWQYSPSVWKTNCWSIFVSGICRWCSSMLAQRRHGIRQAVQHLAAMRHEHIGFVSGPLKLRSAVARKDAFEESMREIGLPVRPEFIVQGDHRLEGGKLALQKLYRLREQPTALLCSNDMTAIGVMRQAFELGVTVPQELSVVGFDDTRLADFMIPPLTTVQMSQKELARLAFGALFEEVKRKIPSPEGTEYHLKTQLVLRSSTTFPTSHVQAKSRPPAKRAAQSGAARKEKE
jgi:DNA-binding LacI/PurR family transcriptional regulator